MVAVVDDPERDSFHEVVDRFCWPARDTGCVPGADLVLPAQQGPAELVCFDGVIVVLEVVAKPIDEDELLEKIEGLIGK